MLVAPNTRLTPHDAGSYTLAGTVEFPILWNNLNVAHIIIAIFVIGAVGLLLEWSLLAVARRFDYS